MIVLITGTPGVGKSSLAKLLAKELGVELYRISEMVDDSLAVARDELRDSLEVDIEGLYRKLKSRVARDAVIEGHLSHLLAFEDAVVIVLRAEPPVLRERLRAKGFEREKMGENLEAEALDVCLVESLERHSKVYEVDTSNLSLQAVLKASVEIISGRGEGYLPGKVDFSEYLLERNLW